MSSVVVAGDTSGSVTLQAPAVAGSTVITLPTTSGTMIATDASGDVGVGLTPNTWSLGKAVEINSGGNALWSAGPADIRLNAGAYYNGAYKYGNTGSLAATYEIGGGTHIWRTAPSGTINNTITFTQAMTLDASGYLMLNTTGLSGARGYFEIQGDSASVRNLIATNNTAAGTGSVAFVAFSRNGTYTGGISQTGTTSAFVTSSDYRLKDNVTPMVGALAKVALLKPVTYTWKLDGSVGQGFIAHELQEVVPDAVTGEKDAVNEDGSIKSQGIDTSYLVATLTAAIQEQQALIENLTTRLSALENK